jgi:hypothetical protein
VVRLVSVRWCRHTYHDKHDQWFRDGVVRIVREGETSDVGAFVHTTLLMRGWWASTVSSWGVMHWVWGSDRLKVSLRTNYYGKPKKGLL